MPLIQDSSYFVGLISLPSSDYSNHDYYLGESEEKVLVALLGPTEYARLKADATVEPFKGLVDGAEYNVKKNGRTFRIKWPGLVNDAKKSLIAYHAYRNIVINDAVTISTTGPVVPNKDNSSPVSVTMKVIRASAEFDRMYGNQRADVMIPSAYQYLMANSELIPDWYFTDLTDEYSSHDL